MDAKQIAKLRALRDQGVTFAVGEYTPDELWDALDEIERLRSINAELIMMLEYFLPRELPYPHQRGDPICTAHNYMWETAQKLLLKAKP